MIMKDVYFPTEEVRMAVFSLDPYMIAFENHVNAGTIRHSNTPLLNYCIGCTQAELDQRSLTGVRKPVKASEMDLIDGTLSSMLAVGKSFRGEYLTADDIIVPD